MKIQALRGMVGSYGALRRGQVADIDDHIAEKLVKAGRAVPVEADAADPIPASEPGPVSGADAKDTRRAGGRAGKAKPASSSPADPAPETSGQASQPSEGKPA
ncbi:hypothetical protein [Paracoccus versutus]|uniref:hypothetical protein n=1 Tax=Paracoccus versutus TaxID=34007 RepID=UPI000E24CBA5|nr:hypothetical protein [Paracoccus versutus]WGR57703.1 hypothetical protein E3U25_17230 [Paracoccus versutus]